MKDARTMRAILASTKGPGWPGGRFRRGSSEFFLFVVSVVFFWEIWIIQI